MYEPNDGDRARALGRKVRAWSVRILGGRYSRDAWLAATLLYISTVALVILPLATFIWTSPRPLRELYIAFLTAVAAIALLGLVLAYAKRLHDQGRIGLWAAVPLIAIPWVLISAASAWAEHIWKRDPSASSSDYLNVALGISFLLAIAVALLPPRDAKRFGARSGWKDVLAPLRLPMLLLVSVIAISAAVTIYAGFFQDGVWVRRGEIEFDYGTPASIGEGAVLASCGGAKGISAVSQQDQEGGFVRDAVPGSWSLIRRPDGTFDIQTSGKSGSISYRQDGFAVDVPGLRLTEFGRVAPDMEGFQVIAQGQDDAGDVRTVMTMSFVKHGHQYQAVIASSRLVGKNSMLTALSGGHPRASTFLMIADCIVY